MQCQIGKLALSLVPINRLTYYWMALVGHWRKGYGHHSVTTSHGIRKKNTSCQWRGARRIAWRPPSVCRLCISSWVDGNDFSFAVATVSHELGTLRCWSNLHDFRFVIPGILAGSVFGFAGLIFLRLGWQTRLGEEKEERGIKRQQQQQ